jgi:hypothetical protein
MILPIISPTALVSFSMGVLPLRSEIGLQASSRPASITVMLWDQRSANERARIPGFSRRCVSLSPVLSHLQSKKPAGDVTTTSTPAMEGT